MSKKLTIAVDERQYAWVLQGGNASHAIRALIDEDIVKYEIRMKTKWGSKKERKTKFPEHGIDYSFDISQADILRKANRELTEKELE